MTNDLLPAPAAPPANRMGVEIGGEWWLVDLAEIIEVATVPAVTRVPQTRAWFAGIAGVRGRLWSVIDLAAFMGRGATPANGPRRVLLLQPRLMPHCGLIVAAMLGLRHAQDWEPLPLPADAPTWLTERHQEPGGRIWQTLSLRELVRLPALLDIACPISGEAQS